MSQTRQLAAIMFTDIVGYTALMGKDEKAALKLLENNRKLHKSAIQEFNGRWLKEMGDGTLISFNSGSDAVNCARRILEDCKKDGSISLRIGIHQGEVVFDDKDVFGDGVNIASRIEAITPAGCIYISESVSRNMENKKGLNSKFIDEMTFKNVKYPVRIYQVIDDNEPDVGTRLVEHNFSENSIAVLPFINISSDPEQDYFSDGLTEEIITDLSKLGKLLVISRSSMMTFKGTTKKVKEIANEVGVRYVLEGSVRKVGNKLRIAAQLIDAQNDGHLWAEKYSGMVEDIFDIQEKVSKSIVESLDIQLTRKEELDLAHHPTHDSRTLEFLMRARYEISKLSEKGFLAAIVLVEKGLEIVGEDAQLLATLSLANLFLHHYGFRTSSTQVEKAKKQANQSLYLDPQCRSAQLVLGILEFYVESNKQRAAIIFKKMLERENNNPDALRWLALSYLVLGKEDEARPISIRLLQLDPATPETNGLRGWVEFHAGLFQEATQYYEKWLQMDPDQPFTQYYTALFFAINNEPNKSIQLLNSLVLMFPDSIYEKFAFFFRSALKGDKENTLRYATEELRTTGVSLDWLSLGITLGYAFISDKEETLKWCTIMLKHGLWTYTLFSKIDAFRFLDDHSDFRSFMDEVKRRSEGFEI